MPVCLTLCNFDNIMHAINETLILITIFLLKPKIFVEINGPLSSMNFYNKFIHFFIEQHKLHSCNKRESEKLHPRLYRKHSEICIIGQYLKSIDLTKFDTAQLLLADEIRMTACSKEKRTLFKTSPKLSYKHQYF